MKKWMNIVENALLAENAWDMAPWQLYAFQHGAAILDNPARFISMVPEDKKLAAHKVIIDLQKWRTSERKVFRVIAIGDWNEEHEGDHQAAALAWVEKAKLSGGRDFALGNHWSMNFHYDHYGQRGASIGYDSDLDYSEIFPVLIAGKVNDASILWGTTIMHNVIYPHEEEITIEGKVHVDYMEVDDDFIQVNAILDSGPYNEDYK